MPGTILDELNALVAACDAHHHFYHYKSSWQHLCLADRARVQGDAAGAHTHYKAALFQDHLNARAKAGLESKPIEALPPYDSHVTSGAITALAAFEASLGWEPDESITLCEQGKFEEALRISSARHDRYHRHASDAHLQRGMYFLEAGETDLAIADFSKALDLYRNNASALEARASAYAKKENGSLERADRERLQALRKNGGSA